MSQPVRAVRLSDADYLLWLALANQSKTTRGRYLSALLQREAKKKKIKPAA